MWTKDLFLDSLKPWCQIGCLLSQELVLELFERLMQTAEYCYWCLTFNPKSLQYLKLLSVCFSFVSYMFHFCFFYFFCLILFNEIRSQTKFNLFPFKCSLFVINIMYLLWCQKRLRKIHTMRWKKEQKWKKKLYGDSHIILNKGNSEKTNRNVQIRSPKFWFTFL